MTHQIKAAIVGVTGYAGVELLRLLYTHPSVTISAMSSVSFEGLPISDIYPSLKNICDNVCGNADNICETSDVIFACLPHGLSQDLAAQCCKNGKVFIDLGADFRLSDEKEYTQWYGGAFSDAALHRTAVYAIPELFRQAVKGSKLIANPGCYPTSIGLGLYPALSNNLIEPCGIIIDSKSGVTGAGRSLSQTTHFPDCNEAFSPYKVATHRHTPEIEQTLSVAAGQPVKVTFVPHLLPVNRGILSTMYARIKNSVSPANIRDAYKEAYGNEVFIRLLDDGSIANLRNVKYSNYCDISLHIDKRTHTLIVVSAIDNMVKGAAGQAIQNMNIVFGLPEQTGLDLIPPSF